MKYYNKTIELNPNYTDALFKKGRCLRLLFKYYESIDYFDQVLKMDPNYKDACRYRQYSINALKYLDKNNSKSDEYFKKAYHLQSENKLQEALSFYNKALESDPKNLKIYINKAFIYQQLKKHIKAIECCNDRSNTNRFK